ncbi:TPA: IS3 family transposase, partial [Streptococcus agalactiae]
LKHRQINRKHYQNIKQVQLDCFEYIENFYNNYIPHTANLGLTPNQKEENYFNAIK